MKKRYKKLPRYDLGTMKRLPLGYQPNKGIGGATFGVERGQSIAPEVRAMQANYMPNTLSQASNNFSPLMTAFQNTKQVPLYAPNVVAASSAAPAGTGTALGMSGQEVASVAPDLATTTGTSAMKTVGTAVGNVAAAAGALYGGYSIYNDIANAGEHRTASDMQSTLSRNTYTTAGGNTYTTYGGPNASQELAYQNQARRAKQTSFALNTTSTGASLGFLAGSMIPVLGNFLGTGIGAGVGALVGGLGSLFGFGDNEDEVKEELRNLADATGRWNQQSEAVARSKDMETAANGKRPVWTPSGLLNKKATARVSNGEIVGSLEDGIATRIPGKKNNKDTKLANLRDGDFVISNRYGLSDYAAATGDYLGALNLQEQIMGRRNSKGYKNGKLPGFNLGKYGEYALSILPHIGGLMGNIARYNRAKNADTYAPDIYVEDSEGRAAVNALANLRYNVNPYLRDAQRALAQQNWNVRRNVGLGLGGRAVAQNANFQSYLNSLANIYNAKNEAENKYTTVYADYLSKLGAANRQYRTAGRNNQFQWRQQQNAAKEAYLDQIPKDIYTVASSLASDWLRTGQYHDSLDLQNKQLGIWQQSANTDRIKALSGFNNTQPSETSTFTPVTTHRNDISPELEELQRRNRLGIFTL